MFWKLCAEDRLHVLYFYKGTLGTLGILGVKSFLLHKTNNMQETRLDTESTFARIWQMVQLIPYGKVACYRQIADLAGLSGRARMEGKALGKVPEGG